MTSVLLAVLAAPAVVAVQDSESIRLVLIVRDSQGPNAPGHARLLGRISRHLEFGAGGRLCVEAPAGAFLEASSVFSAVSVLGDRDDDDDDDDEDETCPDGRIFEILTDEFGGTESFDGQAATITVVAQ